MILPSIGFLSIAKRKKLVGMVRVVNKASIVLEICSEPVQGLIECRKAQMKKHLMGYKKAINSLAFAAIIV